MVYLPQNITFDQLVYFKLVLPLFYKLYNLSEDYVRIKLDGNTYVIGEFFYLNPSINVPTDRYEYAMIRNIFYKSSHSLTFDNVLKFHDLWINNILFCCSIHRKA